MSLRVKPVKRYGNPGFPTCQVLEEHPELLRLVPRRWRSKPLVLAALSGVCVLLTACRNTGDARIKPGVNVAPIFEHGSGRGAFGCVMVNPPAFLSEQDACELIREEAAKAGISFKGEGESVSRFPLPVTLPFGPPPDKGFWKSLPPKTKRGTLALDGTDPSKQVSFEYVSSQDHREWEWTGYKSRVSVSSTDARGAADTVRQGLMSQGPDGYYGVFYEPFSDTLDIYSSLSNLQSKSDKDREKAWKEAHERAAARAKEDLRAQVKDFIDWLKGQGVV